MDEASKQYTAFTVGNLGFFKSKHRLFGLGNAPAMFQRLMQSALGELNLTNCLIYLNDMIVFSKMKQEHLQHLHIVFNHFQEHNLRLKPTKCKFFWDENQLFVSPHLQRVCEAQQREVKSCGQVCSAPNLYGNLSLSGLGGELSAIHQRFACITQPLHRHLSEEGVSKKGKHIMFTEKAKDTFETFKKLYLRCLCWLLLTSTSHFSWKLIQVIIRSCAIPKTD